MPYSVSPRVTFQIIGGKNRENRSTRMPTALATTKWPASCRMMSRAKPRKARRNDMGAVRVWQALR